jgi:hypothetical protein
VLPAKHNIQRLIVNPATGKLYVAEADSGPTIKPSNDWLEIDPEAGDSSIRIIKLPFNALEGAFDQGSSMESSHSYRILATKL